MRTRRRLTWIVAFLLVLGAAATFATASGGVKRSPSAILFVSDQGRGYGLYLVDSDGRGLRRLVDGATSPQWSPDGTAIAFQAESDYDLYVVRADGSGRRRLTRGGAGEFTWSPDGKRIVYRTFRDPFGISVVSLDGGAVRTLTDGGGGEGDSDPVWSPDGAAIAFKRSFPDPSGMGSIESVYVMKPDGSGLKELRRDVDVATPVWSPDGKQIAFTQDAPNSILTDVYVVSREGGDAHKISRRPLMLPALAWSPRGDLIAVSGAPDADAEDDLFVLRSAGGAPRKVAEGRTNGFDWSPDGSELVFARGEPDDLWVVGVDGGAARRLTQGYRFGYGSFDPHWHPKALPAARIGGAPVSASIGSDSVIVRGTLETRHRIERLAVDGSRVAMVFADTGDANCVELWESASGRVTRFLRGCGSLELALAGTRAAWLTYEQGNHLYLDIATASPSRPGPVGLAGLATGGNLSCTPGSCPYAGEGDLRGDGSLLVFDTWSQKGGPCEAVQCFREDKMQGTLWRAVGDRTVKIRSERAGLTALGADDGRIAALRSDGPVEVVAANGSLLRSVRFKPRAVQAAVLTGDALVVQTGKSIVAFSVGKGKLRHTWRLPHGARLQGAQGGLAVYLSGRIVHLLRLADGRDATIRPPGQGAVQATIGSAGLFYSYSVPRSPRPGRVAFVSLPTLARRFR